LISDGSVCSGRTSGAEKQAMREAQTEVAIRQTVCEVAAALSPVEITLVEYLKILQVSGSGESEGSGPLVVGWARG